jgi:hypothetical protein
MALALTFPTDYMTLEAPVGTSKKPLCVFQAADTGMAVQLGFFFSSEPPASLGPQLLAIGKPICRADVGNGESVSIVVRTRTFNHGEIPSATTQSFQVLDPNFPIGVQQQNLAAILWRISDDGGALEIVEVGGVSVTRLREPGR